MFEIKRFPTKFIIIVQIIEISYNYRIKVKPKIINDLLHIEIG